MGDIADMRILALANEVGDLREMDAFQVKMITDLEAERDELRAQLGLRRRCEGCGAYPLETFEYLGELAHGRDGDGARELPCGPVTDELSKKAEIVDLIYKLLADSIHVTITRLRGYYIQSEHGRTRPQPSLLEALRAALAAKQAAEGKS